MRAVSRQPQSKRVFLVADKPAALSGFERAPAQSGVRCRMGAGGLFSKPQHAAGKSVASMSAMACARESKPSSKGASSASLTRRNPAAHPPASETHVSSARRESDGGWTGAQTVASPAAPAASGAAD